MSPATILSGLWPESSNDVRPTAFSACSGDIQTFTMQGITTETEEILKRVRAGAPQHQIPITWVLNGNCPECGAPIYGQNNVPSSQIPQAWFTCTCFASKRAYTKHA